MYFYEIRKQPSEPWYNNTILQSSIWPRTHFHCPLSQEITSNHVILCFLAPPKPFRCDCPNVRRWPFLCSARERPFSTQRRAERYNSQWQTILHYQIRELRSSVDVLWMVTNCVTAHGEDWLTRDISVYHLSGEKGVLSATHLINNICTARVQCNKIDESWFSRLAALLVWAIKDQRTDSVTGQMWWTTRWLSQLWKIAVELRSEWNTHNWSQEVWCSTRTP